ncbi:MAG: hypothetical protein HY332_10715 [Chloroflexi bacterium]|nr:hypothetical protein [Chloroflexota bacterium]
MPTMLLNYVYYNPVGHVAEALKFARGFHVANPGLQVHLLLNRDAPYELASACDWILAEVQGKTNLRSPEAGMAAFHVTAAEYFRARRGRVTVDYPVAEWLGQLPGLGYAVDAHVRLRLPDEAVAFTESYAHAGPKICVLLGGSSGPAAYPSARSWMRILRALARALPDARLYLSGVRRSAGGRTHTRAYTDVEVETVLTSVPNLADCYDLGLWRQLALVEQCDVFLSPHTGFGFIAQCVGTSWLVISGGHYCEGSFHNGVPWYSVLPDNPAYPYLGSLKFNVYGRRKIPCMRPEKLEKKIPEIVEGARLLLDPSFTYEASIQRHHENWARANVRQDVIPHGPRY